MSLEHKQRWIAAVVGVALLAAVYLAFGHGGLIGITVAVAAAAYAEFLQFSGSVAGPVSRGATAALGALLCLWLSLGWPGAFPAVYLAVLAVLLRGLWLAHRAENILQGFQHVQARVFGLVYFCVFLAFVPRVHALAHGPAYFGLLLGIIWIGDTGAYYGGKLCGRHKLSPHVSPGKTREGAASALVFCALFAVAMQAYALPHLPAPKVILISLLTSVVAQAGDLLESLMKRAYGVKDSGHLIPGHGGVFDRFDSLILAAPFFYLLLRILT